MTDKAAAAGGHRPEQSLRTWLAVTITVAAVLAAIVLTRGYDDAQFHSARNGVEWTHHTLRVQLAEELPGWNPVKQVEWLASADRDYPPLVPALAALAGFLVGHDEASIHRFGFVWAVLLAMATGLLVHGLSRNRKLAMAGSVAALLLPAHHAAALSFYFDLPMAALLWSALAVLVVGQDRRPILAGLLAGLLLFLSCLAKWTALPVAAPLLLGVLSIRPPERSWDRDLLLLRARAALPLVLSSSWLVLCCWRISPRSWNRMLSMSFGSELDPRTGFEPVGWWHTLTSTLGAVPEAISMGRHMTLEALYWYPLHFLFCFLSVPVTVLLLLASLPWLRNRSREVPLLLWALLGHLFLIYTVFTSLDERFLLTLGPALLLPPLLGWWALPALPRRLFAGVFVLTSLWVAWDFHHSEPEPRVSEGFAEPEPTGTLGRVWAEIATDRQGIGLQSSTDRQWGWMRADALRPAYFQLRERLWDELLACGAQVVLAQEELTLDGFGEGYWWEFRKVRAHLEGQQAPRSIVAFQGREAVLLSGEPTGIQRAMDADEVVAITRYQDGLSWDELPLPDELQDTPLWTLRARIDRTAGLDPSLVLLDGPRELALWTPPGSNLCSQLQSSGGAPAELP